MPTMRENRAKLAALKQELETQEERMSDNGVGLHITLADTQIDGQGYSWIEVMPTIQNARNGDWYFTVTAEDLGTLAEYIQANPDRIPIDYDHAGAQDGSTRAAGWFTGQAKLVESGEKTPNGDKQQHESVWAQVNWTPTAVEEIRTGAFRFVSPEWHFEKKDPKTGLMTKLADLAAATLTNRPFFKELAPVRAMLESEQVDAIAETYGDEIAEFVLAASGDDSDATEASLQKVLGAVWTTAFINNLPDSSFLYIEPGGEKDSDGKTTPRSLRHFPVKDANGSADLAHVRNALARSPQSNVPAAAKASATAAAQRLLRDAGGNPSATDQGDDTQDKETTVADEQPVTDYMKILGLDESVDPKGRLAAAFRDKDEKILALETKVTELTAAGGEKNKEAEELASRVEELEQKDREREISVLLTRAVDKGRILPAEKSTLSELFAKDVTGLKRLIAARPENFVTDRVAPQGAAGEPDRFVDDPDIAQLANDSTYKYSDTRIDTEQGKQHLVAMELLKEQGKATTYTDDEYVAAYTRAATLVY